MSTEHIAATDPRIARAVEELQGLIQQRYPEASFDVVEGDDPAGVYLRATVDVDDTDAVMDVVIDRLLELEDEQALPVYVVPVRPLTRIAARLEEAARDRTLLPSQRPLPL